MAISPYVSSKVLRAVVSKNILFPDTVLYCILKTNPDALNSASLFDSIAAVLPSGMVDSLIADTIITSRTILELQMDSLKEIWHYAARLIINGFYSDTTGVDHDSIRNILGQLNEREAQYMIVGDFLATGHYDSANVMLASLADSSFVNQGDSDLLVYYNQLAFDLGNNNLLAPLDSGEVVNRPKTSLDITTYNALAANTSYPSGNFARNVLRYFNNNYVEEWPILPAGINSLRTLSAKPNTKSSSTNTWAKVYPNPANDELSVQYNLPGLSVQPHLIISDLTGRILYDNELTLNQGNYHVNVKNWNTGSYIYNIRSNEKGVISGGVFVVSH